MAKRVKMVLFAEPGVGKSTFASKAPKPFFITTDGNFEWLGLPDKDHAQISTWEEAKNIFAKIVNKDPFFDNYETIVVDLFEDMFQWCEMEYCKKNKINHMSDLGFGKAYDETRKEFTNEVGKLIGADKHVLLLTHGITKVEKDRRGVELTKYVPSERVPAKVWAVIEGRVRYFLRAFVKGEEVEGKMIKYRYLSIIPKENEFAIARGLDEANTPEDIPLEWSVFAEVIGLNESTESPKVEVAPTPKPKKATKKVEVPETPTETEPISAVVVPEVVVEPVIPVIEVPSAKPIPTEMPNEVPNTAAAAPATASAGSTSGKSKIEEIRAKLAALKNKQ